jgi:hypothetical protein
MGFFMRALKETAKLADLGDFTGRFEIKGSPAKRVNWRLDPLSTRPSSKCD